MLYCFVRHFETIFLGIEADTWSLCRANKISMQPSVELEDAMNGHSWHFEASQVLPAEPTEPDLNNVNMNLEELPVGNKIRDALDHFPEMPVMLQEKFLEIIRYATSATDDDKVLILTFMAGCTDNPNPEFGPNLIIPLHKINGSVIGTNGQEFPRISERFFVMKYDTGEWIHEIKEFYRTDSVMSVSYSVLDRSSDFE